MKTIRLTIGQARFFRKYVKTPREMLVPDDATFLDLVAELDQEYVRVTKGDGQDHVQDFMDVKIKTLLQLLWNPATRQFYSDVGVEARTAPPASDSIPLEQLTGWKNNIPNGAWIVVTPDAGC